MAIDVELALAHPRLPGVSSADVDAGTPIHFQGQQTLGHMRKREATHVYVLPLRAPNSTVSGMISLEVHCPGAIGTSPSESLIDDDCGRQLQLLADLATPYLSSLPLRPSSAPLPDELLPVIGTSTAGIVQALRVFAQQAETLLLSGPTGVGKSRLAHWCHVQSSRHAGPFVLVDLLSVPAELQAGTLFGWKKGAFTGADRDRNGSLAEAGGGTLFIDEIDNLSLAAQAVLLQVLETRRYRPLGGRQQQADVRFIVGTNADLRHAIREGRFREDLFYRINVLPVKVPALAERGDELPDWAAFMLARCYREDGGSGTATLAAAAVERLQHSEWPGNLRQLDNIVRCSYAFARAEYGDAVPAFVLHERHVEQALLFESDVPAGSLMKLLVASARAFVRELERGRELSPRPMVDTADVLRALITVVAVQHTGGDREAAFRLLGKESLLKSRNHHRELRKALQRIRNFEQQLGGSGESVLDGELSGVDTEPGRGG